MSKKKSLGHSPFESGQKTNSDNMTESAMDDLISTLLLQRDAPGKSTATNSKKEIVLPLMRDHF